MPCPATAALRTFRIGYVYRDTLSSSDTRQIALSESVGNTHKRRKAATPAAEYAMLPKWRIPPSHGRGGNTFFIRPIDRNVCKFLKNLGKVKIWKQVTEEKKRLPEEK